MSVTVNYRPASMDYSLRSVGTWRSVVPSRLCAPVHFDVDEYRRQQGFDRLESLADELAFASSFLESHLRPDARQADATALRNLSALILSIAEGLNGAVIGATEAGLLRKWAAGEKSALRQGHLVTERFLWESAAHFLLGAGHRFANLGLRIGALDSTLPVPPKRLDEPVRLILGGANTDDDPGAWLSESDGASVGSWLLASQHKTVKNLGHALTAFVTNTSWRSLVDLRGRDHHRWRPVTASDKSLRGLTVVDEIANATRAAITEVGADPEVRRDYVLGAAFDAAPSGSLAPASPVTTQRFGYSTGWDETPS